MKLAKLGRGLPARLILSGGRRASPRWGRRPPERLPAGDGHRPVPFPSRIRALLVPRAPGAWRAAACALAAAVALLLGAGAVEANDGHGGAEGHVHFTDMGNGCDQTACPDAPTGHAEPGPGHGQITAHWTPATTGGTVANWLVGRAKSEGGEEFTPVVLAASAREHTFSGLEPGVAYHFDVRGRGSGGETEPGDFARAAVVAFSSLPTVSSAAVNGWTLTVTFSENLDTGSEPAGSAFSVSAETSGGTSRTLDGTDTVDVSGMTATVTLERAVAPGETVEVDYTKPPSNPLQDGDGHDVATFTGRAVTNNSVAATTTGVEISSTPGHDANDDGTAETYTPGEKIELEVTFDKAVTVTGKPRLKIKFDPDFGEVWAEYASGSASTVLTFAYEVMNKAPANLSTRGIAVLGNTLELNGGAIRDENGVDANLAHVAKDHDLNHQVDAKPPRFSSGSINGNVLTATFDEDLDPLSAPTDIGFILRCDSKDMFRREADPVLISGATVTVTMDGAAVRGQACFVIYLEPESNPLRDRAGNKVKRWLVARPLTNETSAAPPEGGGDPLPPPPGGGEDTVPPRVSGTPAVNGATLTIEFSERLRAGSVPPPDAFEVVVGGGAGVRPFGVDISDRTLTLTLATSIARSETVEVRYTPPATLGERLRDSAGNAVASFTRTVSNDTPAGQPVADTGADRTVEPGAAVTLDGSASADPDGGALTYAWTQVSGETVTLSGADTVQATFTAPMEPGVLVFRLTVTDPGGLSAVDTVTVTVRGRTAHAVLFMSASDALGRQGFVRVINHSDEGGEVSIVAIDDAGMHYAPMVLALDAGRTVHFNSTDLEAGNPEKGLSGAVGEGEGSWRLELESALDIEVLSYIRTGDGFVTSMHELAPEDEAGHRVVFFNPGSNRNQVSWLRLINPGEKAVDVTIEGTDDAGEAGESAVSLTLEAGASRMLSAQALESGEGGGSSGRLGDGKGKWRLEVSAPQPIRVMSLLANPTGHLTNLSAATRETTPGGTAVPDRVHLVPSASDPQRRQGFVRVINHSDEGGEVSIVAIDDAGVRYAPVVLALDAGQTTHFNSADLEAGNAHKGLESGIGPGEGNWRLELESALDIEVLSYIRTGDGFVTSMHELTPEDEAGHRVVFFNPGSNRNQVSWLRLINPGEEAIDVSIEGTDDAGEAGEGAVTLTLEAGASRMLSAQALESGEGGGSSGSLGDGKGKWRLEVSAPQPIRVMSLLANPTGHLTNLSAVPERE